MSNQNQTPLEKMLQGKIDELKQELSGETPDYGTIGYGRMEANETFLEWLENLLLSFQEGEFE